MAGMRIEMPPYRWRGVGLWSEFMLPAVVGAPPPY
jgi:hypothetical protein